MVTVNSYIETEVVDEIKFAELSKNSVDNLSEKDDSLFYKKDYPISNLREGSPLNNNVIKAASKEEKSTDKTPKSGGVTKTWNDKIEKEGGYKYYIATNTDIECYFKMS